MNTMKTYYIAAVLLVASAFLFGTTLVSAQSAIGTVVTLTGYFLNAQTLTPVEANYVVIDGNARKVGSSFRSNAADGYLQTGLQPGTSYVIRVEDPRYFKQEYRVDIPATGKYLEVSKDFIVRPMEAGHRVTVLPVPFDLKKSVLKTGADEDLADLTRILVMNPGTNVEIVCYPDQEGTVPDVQKVSNSRADALKAFFVSKGVSAGRISTRTATSTDPIDPPPIRKAAKGKRYVGPVYLLITKV